MLMVQMYLKHAVAMEQTMLLMQIMRNVSTTEKVTGKNQYALRVSAGTDCALMIAFCVVIDELFND